MQIVIQVHDLKSDISYFSTEGESNDSIEHTLFACCENRKSDRLATVEQPYQLSTFMHSSISVSEWFKFLYFNANCLPAVKKSFLFKNYNPYLSTNCKNTYRGSFQKWRCLSFERARRLPSWLFSTRLCFWWGEIWTWRWKHLMRWSILVTYRWCDYSTKLFSWHLLSYLTVILKFHVLVFITLWVFALTDLTIRRWKRQAPRHHIQIRAWVLQLTYNTR